MKKFLALALAGMMVLSMSACGSKDKGGDAAGYKDGTYTSTQKGNNGDVTVEVKIEGGKITSVTTPEQAETAGLGDVAMEKVCAAIVEANSAEVDTVSGATNSSNAVIKGGTECLDQAK